MREYQFQTRRVVFVALGVVLAGLLYRLFAGRSADHIDAMNEARDAIFARGCAMAGFAPASLEMDRCVGRARARCRGMPPVAMQNCAMDLAGVPAEPLVPAANSP